MLENMDKYPKIVGAHWLWADYIEYCCLDSADKLVTKSDMYDTIRENKESNVDSEHEEERGLSSAEVDDRLASQIHQRFEFISIRARLFREAYPFHIDLQQGQITLKQDPDILKNYSPYLFLLLSSGLRYHDRRYQHTLTTMFERVSENTLRNLLSHNAEVHLFSSQNCAMPSTALGKVEWLSQQLSTTLLATKERFQGNTAGEAGLDIVAWHDMGDNLCNRPLYFIQAACSPTEWPKKVYESSGSRWNKILAPSNPSTNMMFIPHSYRDIADNFPKHDDVGDSILFDRSRILKYFSDTDMLLDEPSIKTSLEHLTG